MILAFIKSSHFPQFMLIVDQSVESILGGGGKSKEAEEKKSSEWKFHVGMFKI